MTARCALIIRVFHGAPQRSVRYKKDQAQQSPEIHA